MENKFAYDPFQQSSIDHIESGHSLLVSAPTGSGKTAIAEVVIDKSMHSNKGAIYTAPIKALSNQKYRDFKEKYGHNNVGIITGDVSINPNAPILIMTTEIFRNSLFDKVKRYTDKSWVIFDEIHFIDDYERGTVWEESIMFFPDHLKLLGLSATIPNIHEFAKWIEKTTKQKISVVVETHRPVPLTHIFQCQGQLYSSLSKLRREGYRMHLPRRHFMNSKLKPNKVLPLLRLIQTQQELPVIYFSFGRKRCQDLAYEASAINFLDSQDTKAIMELYTGLLKKHELETDPGAIDMTYLIKKGIAFHHAGMLPTLKEVVEQIFTSRLLKFISTTETFALGINMPARTVIFDELRKFYGTHFGNLRTRDYFQMAGRAGRRGIDDTGFVYSRINPHYMPFDEVKRIAFGQPEPIKSQFNSSYATILNLYQQYGEKLTQVYQRSFHYHQSKKSGHDQAIQQIRTKMNLLRNLGYIENGRLSSKGEFARHIFGYELPITEFYISGFLHEITEMELNIILAALVFEPRKRQQLPLFSQNVKSLKKRSKKILKRVYLSEISRHITPKSKYMYFHLSEAIIAWSRQKDFQEILKLTDTDEGEIIRYFRMVIQLLRELYHMSDIESGFKKKLQRCLEMIKRDMVDAERQLRI